MTVTNTLANDNTDTQVVFDLAYPRSHFTYFVMEPRDFRKKIIILFLTDVLFQSNKKMSTSIKWSSLQKDYIYSKNIT